MASEKLTQDEAERLLSMLKHSLIKEINFPQCGTSIEFDVEGETKQDIFCVNIFRGKINGKKYNISARIKKNGILLLELHINPTNVHINPDGEKLIGSHWHSYDEKYGRKIAFPAYDIKDTDFVENTIKFFDEFNIIEKPKVIYQLEL